MALVSSKVLTEAEKKTKLDETKKAYLKLDHTASDKFQLPVVGTYCKSTSPCKADAVTGE